MVVVVDDIAHAPGSLDLQANSRNLMNPRLESECRVMPSMMKFQMAMYSAVMEQTDASGIAQLLLAVQLPPRCSTRNQGSTAVQRIRMSQSILLMDYACLPRLNHCVTAELVVLLFFDYSRGPEINMRLAVLNHSERSALHAANTAAAVVVRGSPLVVTLYLISVHSAFRR